MKLLKICLLIVSCSLLVILTACSKNQEVVNENIKETIEPTETIEIEKPNKVEVLEKVGQWRVTNMNEDRINGQEELLAFFDGNKKVKIGQLDGIINQIKISKFTFNDKEEIVENYWPNYTNFLVDNNIYSLQIIYHIQNNTEKLLGYTQFNSLSTNLKNQYDLTPGDANEDILGYKVEFDDFLPNTESEYQILEIYLDEESAKAITDVTLNPGESVDYNATTFYPDQSELINIKLDR